MLLELVCVFLTLFVARADTASNMTYITPTGLEDDPRHDFTVRLHLVRHGEAEGNIKNLVLGQVESSLTERGVEQAKSLGLNIGYYPFWRYFTSDQSRAHRTAGLILGMEGTRNAKDCKHGNTSSFEIEEADEPSINGNSNSTGICTTSKPDLRMEARLRERAKGVREGRSKDLNYEEAMSLFRSEQIQLGNTDESKWKISPLETEDDVWNRFREWLDETVHEAYVDHSINNNGIVNMGAGKRWYDVLAVSHSTTLRIAIERMVEDQIPHDAKKISKDENGLAKRRLEVPNTSLTIIEIVPDFSSSGSDEEEEETFSIKRIKWKPVLVQLPSVAHLEK